MTDLNDIRYWQRELGLMAVPLLGGISQRNAFVLLNGARGNFCLELSEVELDLDRRSEAWSANVGHFVSIEEKELVVERWDQSPGTIKRYPFSKVERDINNFYSSIEHSSPSSSFSVIAHALRVFRSLRNALGPEVTGTEALGSFLYLLASLIDDVNRGHVELERWRLTESVADRTGEVDADSWAGLRSELTRGMPVQKLKPDFRLLLRHASGPLFQEAHYLAHFQSKDQQFLSGLELSPDPVSVVKDASAIGLYFTPPSLVRTIVEETFEVYSLDDSGAITVFDPACGSGEFLKEAVRQLSLMGYDGQIRLLGWDSSEAACAMARFALAWETQYIDNAEFSISMRDALAEEWPDVDMILMNPPFLSVRDMNRVMKKRVREILGETAFGRIDLSSAFIWKGVSRLQAEGVLATVLPASFLEGDSAAPLRNEIAQKMTAHLIARLGSQDLFAQAQVDSGLYIGKRNSGHGIATALWSDHRPSSTSAALRNLRKMRFLAASDIPLVGDGYSIYKNPELGAGEDGWAPRPYREWLLLKQLGGTTVVEDCFTVRQGALTGLNRAFIVSQDYFNLLEEPEKLYFRPAIVNESITEGRLRNVAYVFYPYGDYSLTTEKELKKRAPGYYADRLEPHREALKERERTGGTQWWELTRHRSWQVENVTKLVSTYFGERGSFGFDETGEFVVVQGYAWRLKGFGENTTRAIWLAYLALLNSCYFESLLAASSDNVSGGQWNLSIRFVKTIPMPRLPVKGDRAQVTEGLARIGETIQKAGLDALSADMESDLEEYAALAYRVSARS